MVNALTKRKSSDKIQPCQKRTVWHRDDGEIQIICLWSKILWIVWFRDWCQNQYRSECRLDGKIDIIEDDEIKSFRFKWKNPKAFYITTSCYWCSKFEETNNRMLVQRFQNNCLIHLPANPIAQLKKPRRSPLRLRFFSWTLESAFCVNETVICETLY